MQSLTGGTGFRRRAGGVGLVAALASITLAVLASLLVLLPLTAVEFEPVPNAVDLSVQELATFVDVRAIELSAPPQDSAAASEWLWDHFANNAHTLSIARVPSEDWRGAWSLFAAEMLLRAEEAGLPAKALERVLQRCTPRTMGNGAAVPSGAYRLGGGHDALWVIVANWSLGPPEYVGMSHFEASLVRERDCRLLSRAHCG